MRHVKGKRNMYLSLTVYKLSFSSFTHSFYNLCVLVVFGFAFRIQILQTQNSVFIVIVQSRNKTTVLKIIL